MPTIKQKQNERTENNSKPLRVAFLHPDLGIGGAERLIVDAAVGLQQRGHNVVIYTSHHDPTHCFDETRNGTLDVRVRGNTIVPRTIAGKFYIVCAILRQLHLSLLLLLGKEKYNILVVDQLSASIPFLKFMDAKILFYCHFPDKLLTQRTSFLKKLYRAPIDKFEEITTSAADAIAVNSKFTAGVFHESFPTIKSVPQVLYPAIHLDSYNRSVDTEDPSVKILETSRVTIVSINRFERKKNIALAVHAFAYLGEKRLVTEVEFDKLRLIIAGGYDHRVAENIDYHRELDNLASKTYGLKTFTILPNSLTLPPADAQVVFLCSFNDQQRTYILSRALCLLYTPANEHFGIVPIEAMYARVPVIAVNSGGPIETVLQGVTGLLCEPTKEAWAESLRKFVRGDLNAKTMGLAGRDHVKDTFSLEAFVEQLEKILLRLDGEPRGVGLKWGFWVVMLFMGLGLASVFMVVVRMNLSE